MLYSQVHAITKWQLNRQRTQAAHNINLTVSTTRIFLLSYLLQVYLEKLLIENLSNDKCTCYWHFLISTMEEKAPLGTFDRIPFDSCFERCSDAKWRHSLFSGSIGAFAHTQLQVKIQYRQYFLVFVQKKRKKCFFCRSWWRSSDYVRALKNKSDQHQMIYEKEKNTHYTLKNGWFDTLHSDRRRGTSLPPPTEW